MDKIKSTLITTKNHVFRNRGRYAALATASVCYAISRRAVSEWDKFLDEKGLTDEFYAPEEV